MIRVSSLSSASSSGDRCIPQPVNSTDLSDATMGGGMPMDSLMNSFPPSNMDQFQQNGKKGYLLLLHVQSQKLLV